tara:strand:+ start:4113 stop:4787 length:675 start_codon:yes stop_codon:yes gene_type:complete
MHKEVKSKQEVEGLLAHGLPVGKPSQLSDAFILGMHWEQDMHRGLSITPAVTDDQREWHASFTMIAMDEMVRQDSVNGLVRKGWAKQDAEKLMSRILKILDKQTAELRPYVEAVVSGTPNKSPEKAIKHHVTAAWTELTTGRTAIELFTPTGDVPEEKLLVTEKVMADNYADLDLAIKLSGQTLIPNVTYGMRLDYVDGDNGIELASWRLAAVLDSGNVILAES